MLPTSNAISALLPVKNGQEYLTTLVPLILDMLNCDDELIVVNDGSSDASSEIIQKFATGDSRVQLINTSGCGLVGALNLGVQASKKQWIARFDVDDSYSNERIVNQRKFIAPEVVLIFSDYEFVSKTGNTLGRVYSAILPIPSALSLITSQRTAHPVALINKLALQKCGGYDAADFPVEDLALWLKMSYLGKIVSDSNVLLHYQLSSSSVSANNRNAQRIKRNQLISKSKSWGVWQTECLNDFLKTVAVYQTLPNAPQRIFLHLRDLVIAKKHTGIPVHLWRLLIDIGLVMTLKLLLAGVHLSFYTFCRKGYRFIQRNS
jgi:glycosyltransferase involved in cell wall biosynthesis